MQPVVLIFYDAEIITGFALAVGLQYNRLECVQ